MRIEITPKNWSSLFFFSTYPLDFVLFSEIFLSPCNNFNISNYFCYREDRLTGRGGGVVILHISYINTHLSPLTEINIGLTFSNKAVKWEDLDILLDGNGKIIVGLDMD